MQRKQDNALYKQAGDFEKKMIIHTIREAYAVSLLLIAQ
jgi:hypothetical protein